MRRRLRRTWAAVTAAALLAATACAHEGGGRAERASDVPAGTSDEATLAGTGRGSASPPAGKLERLEGRGRGATSEAKDVPSPGEAAEGKGGDADDDLIRIEAVSGGTPGLVLVRAMDGAQALGYTLLSLHDRDLYFIAEKRPSLISRVIGTERGICKIAVETQKDPDSDATQVTLKGRAQTSTARPQCRKDLEKIIRYARGEVFKKPKLPSQERQRGRFAPYAR
jgi:hypothetical protein